MMLIVKRDPKSERVGQFGLLINPGTAYIHSNWVTAKAVPKKVTIRGKQVNPGIKIGDRLWVRPVDGEVLFDLDAEYQLVHYNHIEAVEKDGEILPFNFRVLVKPRKKEEKTAGGLFLPDGIDFNLSGGFTNSLSTMSSNADPGCGTVVAVNSMVKEEVFAGDWVYYNPEQSPSVMIDNEKHYIIKEPDVIGKKYVS